MHIMIDLETLGTERDAAILQIGAVAFTDDDALFEHDPSARFNADIDPASAIRYGNVNADTAVWWGRQEKRVPLAGSEKLDTALIRLRDWIDRYRSRWPLIWSRGAMDTEVLAYAYQLVLGRPQPWLYYHVRDARTLDTVEAFLDIEKPVRSEDHKHEAFADACHQARCVLGVFAALRAASANGAGA